MGVRVMRRKKMHLSLSLIVLIGILIYIIIHIVGFIFKTKLSVYEVKSGQMTEKISTTGIAIRDEKIVKSKSGGYINYYIPDFSKVHNGELIYSLDSTGKIKDYISEEIAENTEASDKAVAILKQTISDFKDSYCYSQFEDTYSLKQKLDNAVLTSNGEYIETTLNKIKNKYGKNAYQIIKSTDNGIVSYTYDNFRCKTIDEIVANDFKQLNYKKKHLSSNEQVKSGDPVYRISCSENWKIAIQLSKEEYNELKDRDSVNLTFLQDNITTTAGLELKEKKNQYFGYLSLSKYMVRYINERYLEIEISVDSNDGYKIPKSSVVEKDFYVVPIEYLTKGGNSASNRVLAKSGNEKTATIKNYTIYKFKEDSEKYFYLAVDEVDKNTVLFTDNKSKAEQYPLEKTEKKKGVYVVNQGYAKFRAIEDIRSDDEYHLILTDTVQGVSQYDHIVLNASDIGEDEIIY